MPAIICPFCQHQNKSGTRFCSNCGCSIHLTICPNPECGKISEVGAAKCAHCGQPFPNAGETADTAGSNGDHKGDGASAMAESEKTRTTAWPLIMMAIVAGGLPLLWANRALLPTPETWKSSASEAAKPTQVVPPTLPLKAAPPPPALAPQVVSTDSVAATSPAAAVPSGDAASSKSSAGPDNAKSTAKEKKNPGAKAGNASRKTGKTPAPEQPPPCTEATVALGLCDAKRAGK